MYFKKHEHNKTKLNKQQGVRKLAGIGPDSGQALVETLIAITVAVIVVTSLVSLAVFSLRNANQGSLTAQATQIAQSQLEYARAFRDDPTTTWLAFTDYTNAGGQYCPLVTSGTVCSFSAASAPTSCSNSSSMTCPCYPSSSSCTFNYWVGFSCASGTCNSTGGTVRVTAVVRWVSSGKTYYVYNSTDFTNWRGK